MRVAIVGIFVMETSQIDKVNSIISEYGEYIEGRMGLPKVIDGVNIITIVMKAPQEKISAMAGKLGNVNGIGVKTFYASI